MAEQEQKKKPTVTKAAPQEIVGAKLEAPARLASTVSDAAQTAAEAVEALRRLKWEKAQGDIVCWCGSPTCCDNLGDPFRFKSTGRPAPRPHRCGGSACC